MSLTELAIFLAAGLATGIFSGSLGVGGALIATPLIRFLGVMPYLAVGTTVPVMLPTTLTGAFTYHRQNLVHFKAVWFTAPTSAAVAVMGAFTTRRVNGHVLMLMTAALIVFAAARLIPRRNASVAAKEVLSPRTGFLGLGMTAGFFSGLLGVGGGFIMVPAFIQLFRFPTKLALGTSLAVISITVIPNLVSQAMVGNIDWKVALGLSLGVIPGARLGALMAIRAPERTLRYVIAVALIIVAFLYTRLELDALLS